MGNEIRQAKIQKKSPNQERCKISTKIPNFAYQIYKHYKSTEYMKTTILSINMIGNEKQKTRQKNTIFRSKMFKMLRPC